MKKKHRLVFTSAKLSSAIAAVKYVAMPAISDYHIVALETTVSKSWLFVTPSKTKSIITPVNI